LKHETIIASKYIFYKIKYIKSYQLIFSTILYLLFNFMWYKKLIQKVRLTTFKRKLTFTGYYCI